MKTKVTMTGWLIAVAVLALGGCATGGAPAGSSTSGAGHFSYTLTGPNVRITIPELPPIDMGPHPAASRERPHLRAMGSKAPYVISVMTPTADKGMSAQQCAQSSASWLIKRHALARQDYLLFKGGNSDTYGFIYSKRAGSGTQLVMYLLSGVEGTHCIEVHISKMSATRGEIREWANGFPRAAIERY